MSAVQSGQGARSLLRQAALQLARKLMRSSALKRAARAVLDRLPTLQERVHDLIHNTRIAPLRRHVPEDARDLSPATQAIHQDLQRRFAARKR